MEGQPLAVVLYERLLPGSQVVNRLQDLNYQVRTVSDPAQLTECAELSKPLLVLADLVSTKSNVVEAIKRLRQHAATSHLPVIAFGCDDAPDSQNAAAAAGATLVAGEIAILSHLPQLLERALEVP
jgi:PleD family two-component response regulator